MTDREFMNRAAVILHNMSLERAGFWASFFRRWHINHEPLRNDAANLLNEAGLELLTPNGCRRVGDDGFPRPQENTHD